MASIIVREAHQEEAAAIARLMVASRTASRRGIYDDQSLEGLPAEDAERELSRPPASPEVPRWVWVVESQAELLGFARAEPWRESDSVSASTVFLSHVYVHPGHFREGLGSVQIAATAERLRRLGFHTLRTWVVADAHDAVRFYVATGWVRVGKRGHRILDRRRVIELFELQLAAS